MDFIRAVTDGTEPDLDFLKSIEDISGFLIIMNSSIREIPLSSLKVIRGQGVGYKIHEDLPPAALLIRHNYDSNRILHRINFNQLRAIENGDVYMFDNPSGCNLIGGLVFKSLFTNPAEQRFHNSLDVDLPIVNSSLNEPCQSSNSGALVAISVPIWEVRGDVSDAHQCTSSERSGQLYFLNPASNGGGGIRISHQGGSMMLPLHPR
ncbi:hypothetical protein ACTXT7_005809 [Hymenolepis weldensis]